MGSGKPPLRVEPGGGGEGGSPPSRPECSTRRRLWDVQLLVAWPPLQGPHLLVCKRPGRRDSCAAAVAASAAARRHPHRRRNSSRRNLQRQKGRGGQEGAKQEGRGQTPCALAGTTCPLAGPEGKGGTAATPDTTGFAVRQGRPRGGQGREKRGVSSQTPRGLWDFAMHPYPGRCCRPCFMVRLSVVERQNQCSTQQNV